MPRYSYNMLQQGLAPSMQKLVYLEVLHQHCHPPLDATQTRVHSPPQLCRCDLICPAGCIQSHEPSGLHRQNEEPIKRYGGTTAPEAPWPEERLRRSAMLEDLAWRVAARKLRATWRQSIRSAISPVVFRSCGTLEQSQSHPGPVASPST